MRFSSRALGPFPGFLGAPPFDFKGGSRPVLRSFGVQAEDRFFVPLGQGGLQTRVRVGTLDT
jgi:hypothetical protein